MPLGLAGAILGGVGELAKIYSGFHQNQLANKINPVYTPYETSKYTQSQLGLAQQLYGGRMAGAQDLERNIQSGQAQTLNNVNRNATDSSQALALGMAAQGQSNNAFQNLQIREGQNKYNLLGNLNQAYGAMTEEADKVYQDKLMKYQLDVQQKNALRGAGLNNIFSGIGGLAGGAVQADQLGLFGGGGGNQGVQIGAPPSWVNGFQDPNLAGPPQTQNPFQFGAAPNWLQGFQDPNLAAPPQNPYGFIGPRNR